MECSCNQVNHIQNYRPHTENSVCMLAISVGTCTPSGLTLHKNCLCSHLKPTCRTQWNHIAIIYRPVTGMMNQKPEIEILKHTLPTLHTTEHTPTLPYSSYQGNTKTTDFNSRKYLYISRVLARISKVSVQDSIHKVSAHPDLATQLLQILVPATFSSQLCQKGQFTLQQCPRRWFVRRRL